MQLGVSNKQQPTEKESNMSEDDKIVNLEGRRRVNEITNRMLLKKRFDDLAGDVLPGEGFPEDEITDAMIRSLCHRIGDRKELMEWVEDIADMWFEEKASKDQTEKE